MVYDPMIHHRRSIRLKNNDYSCQGAYYVTICTQKRICHFGEVINNNLKDSFVELSEVGRMIENAWQELPKFYAGVELDEFILMPNHIHGIFSLQQSGGISASDVVHRFKSWTTHLYNQGVKQQHWPTYEKRFWHRNYYEHVIRDDDDLNRIRQYITNNPSNWLDDKLNPRNPL